MSTTVSTPMTSGASTSPTRAPGVAHRAVALAEAERPLTATTDLYMHRAAHALALAAVRDLRRARGRVAAADVLLLVGGGHNGGDALLAGALLRRRGCAVTAVLATDHPHPAALEEALRAGVRTVGDPVAACRAAAAGGTALVLDGLTGIGAVGALRPRAAALVEELAAAGGRGERPFRVLAVDLPSGTGVDDGTLPGPVLVADLSVTFTSPKGAHLLPPAAGVCGRVEVVDLGLPVPTALDTGVVSRPDDAELGRLLRVPGDADHKYTRGVVGLWAGSRAYPGAAVLSASAAVHAGAGMVRLTAPRRVEDLVLARRPEVVPAQGRCQALVVGPGTDPADLDRFTELDAALVAALGGGDAAPLPAVVDAGALPLLAERLRTGARCLPVHVLTPHAGEAAALLTALGRPTSRERVEEAPGASALDLVGLTGATVVLKGTPTLVAAPASCPSTPPRLASLDAGPGWLATAGSGDVLAGVLGAVLAAARCEEENGGAPVDPLARAALGVRLHAVAGLIASGADGGAPGRPVAALDVADRLPQACVRVGRWTA